MTFKTIDQSNWKRQTHFNHYFNDVPCTYSMTVKLDITSLKRKHWPLYPTLLYAITTIVNQHEEFRTAFNEHKQLGVYDELIPCYTVFDKTTELFSTIWTPYHQDFKVFLDNYEKDRAMFLSSLKTQSLTIMGKVNPPMNTFFVSMVPWVSFDGFNLNLQKGYDYLLPIFTIGKYSETDERFEIPFAIQVHHAISDGYHVGRFIDELQTLLNTITKEETYDNI